MSLSCSAAARNQATSQVTENNMDGLLPGSVAQTEAPSCFEVSAATDSKCSKTDSSYVPFSESPKEKEAISLNPLTLLGMSGTQGGANLNMFLSANKAPKPMQLSKDALKRIQDNFQRLDKDGNGFVSAQELQEAMSGGLIRSDVAAQLVEAAMSGADQSQDGLLDWEEFLSLHVEEEPAFHQRHRNKIEACCCIFYFILAPLVYCNLNHAPEVPDWSVWDALYFATTTVTTVGYGDLGPVTDEMKIFTMFYILYGLIIVAGVVSNVAAAMIAWYEDRLKDAQGSMFASMTSVSKKTQGSESTSEPLVSGHSHPSEVGRHTSENMTATTSAISSEDHEMTRLVTRKLLLSLALFLCPIVVGTVFFKFNEDWSWIDAMYWSLVTTTTVGFGDLRLEHESSRIFSIFFILVGFMFVGGAIGNLGSMKLELKFLQERSQMMKRSLSTKMIADLDRDGNGVERWEFLCAMLVQLGKVTEEDLQPLLDKFDELDVDGSGKLTHEDLQALRKKKLTQKNKTEEVVTGGNGMSLPTLSSCATAPTLI